MSNGLDIKTKAAKNKRTIVQTEAPKQFEHFRGSKYSRVVKTEIEDEQITSIKSNSNIHLQSQPEEGQIVFGPKDFTYDIQSEISSNEVKYEEKEYVELVTHIASKFTLINSKDLLEKFEPKKEGEEIPVNQEKSLRNLANFPISASKPFNIASFDVLGQTVTIKYLVCISSNQAYNKLVITSGLGTFEFGNKGCSGTIKDSYNYNKHIFTFVVPYTLGIVSVGCYAKGGLNWELGFQSGYGTSSKYYASISGNLKLGAEIKAGWDVIASLSAFAEGTVFEAKGSVILSNRSVANGSGFSLKMGKLLAGIRGCVAGGAIKGDIYTLTIFEGWKVI